MEPLHRFDVDASRGRATRPSPAPGPRALPASPSDERSATAAKRARHFEVLQQWRREIDAAGYATTLSLLPPFGLIVRAPSIAGRWVVLSPNRSVAVFELDEQGQARCFYELLEIGDERRGARAMPSPAAALAVIRRHLT